MSTHAYVAEPADVDALADELLGEELAEPDPTVRYTMLSKAGALYDALVSRIADERARCAYRLHTSGGGALSLAGVADALQLGGRPRAQQLVERGRAVNDRG